MQNKVQRDSVLGHQIKAFGSKKFQMKSRNLLSFFSHPTYFTVSSHPQTSDSPAPTFAVGPSSYIATVLGMPAPPFAQQAFRTAKANGLADRQASLLYRNKNGARPTSGATVGIARRWASSYPKYSFPTIPRPKRNLLYYNPMGTIKRGFSQLPLAASKPLSFVRRTTSFTFQGIRYRLSTKFRRVPLGNNNFFVRGYGSMGTTSRGSSNKGKGTSGKAKRTFLKFWAIPTATTIILWTAFRGVARKDPNAIDEAGKPAQPWKVTAYSTLPLKAMSRWWGKFNDITLPVWMREPGYKLYSYIFGANLDEVAEEDLRAYSNLGEFFYRELKPGARPIDEHAPLVSPADGKILHLGIINDGQVEQVKGITYSLEALLGSSTHSNLAAPSHQINFEETDEEVLERHKEFANMNGISYTVDELIGGGSQEDQRVESQGDATDASVSSETTRKVAKEVLSPFTPQGDKELFFAVIYLAPGDYHRFHSPTNWVSELRRHFVGELYSVAPYFQRTLSNLFVLNERVALLGKWKYGFFSMTPVGATNVGSIRLHFDKDLTTNTIYENEIHSSTSVDSEQSTNTQSSKRKRVQKATCYEATYNKASPLLGGYPLLKGQQMGGFNLGSTVVLVFEAPKNFQFTVSKGQLVKVGQPLGDFA